MKAISFLSCALMLCVASVALSQSEMQKPEGQKADAQRVVRSGGVCANEGACGKLERARRRWERGLER